MPKKILIASDQEVLRHSLAQALRGWGYIPVEATTAAEALVAFDSEHPAATVLDLNLSDGSGLVVLRELKRRQRDSVVIVITANVLFDDVMTALRSGAYDFFAKPTNLEELEVRIRNGIEKQTRSKGLHPTRWAGAPKPSFDQIIGRSPAMQDMLRLARKVAESGVSSVLLQGESGTGKDLLAKAIHYASRRADLPFVAINCAALPPNLIESELFGYEKGAFTDARARKEGLLEQDDGGGTILLDEISELDLNLQAKLLRVQEEGSFRRVGGLKDVAFNARVIAASNRDLKCESDAERFRLDLYYRLAVVQIDVPPLRERGDDVLLLAQHFINTFGIRNGRQNIRGLAPEVARAFRLYDWPGNVRELMNVIERVMILEDGDVISARHLPRGIVPDVGDGPLRHARMRVVDTDASVSLPREGISLIEVQTSLIKQALARSGGNQTRAAELLGLTRDQFRYRLKKLTASNLRRRHLVAVGGSHN
jgi:two-component system, NtrC family, response regulator AtoC